MFAVSTFLGFKDGRNSRVLLELCCTWRYVDRAADPGAVADEAGARLATDVEPDPPPELLL
jgi:hypothetical protein